MRFNKKLFSSLIFILFSPLVCAANQMLHYEPEAVTLTGKVEIKTFPGAPNYQNIKDGDAAETGAYLKLNKPIDVIEKKNEKLNEKEKNVTLIQLVDVNRADWQALEKGGVFRITGTLFHSYTGHHHTAVLINVKKIESIGTKGTP